MSSSSISATTASVIRDDDMRRMSKHNASLVSFRDFTGGINVSVYGEQIAENELQVCENFLYEQDSLKLMGRGGLSAPLFSFEANVIGVYHDADSNTQFVFLENRAVWLIVNNTMRKIGDLTGNTVPVCCKFQNKLWIASGGKLQYTDYTDIYTVMSSYDCDIVFERFGRLAVTKTGQDYVYYSAVGDGANWEENTSDDSTSKKLEIGYGDSGDIIAVVPLSTDLMVIKSNGNIYQLSGDKNWLSWQVNRVATATSPVGIGCAANIGQDVVYLSQMGMKMLSTTMDYGNIATAMIGDKFNRLLTRSQYEPKMHHLHKLRTLLIQPTNDRRYIVAFNYALKAATVLKFSVPVSGVIETNDEDIFLAADNALYQWDKAYTTDNGEDIIYKLKLKDILGTNKLIVKSVDTLLHADTAGTATVNIDHMKIEVPTNDRQKRRCNHSTARIEVDIESTYRFEPANIALEVADL